MQITKNVSGPVPSPRREWMKGRTELVRNRLLTGPHRTPPHMGHLERHSLVF